MRRLVLVGAGHAHAQVLLAWRAAPVPGVELVLVSPTALAPYSGMVPGWLAGTYRFEDICIDVPALAAAAGARWLPGELAAVAPCQRRLVLDTGETLDYDLLSLNIGSTLVPPAAEGSMLLPLRPLGLLQARWAPLLAGWAQGSGARPHTVTAVGGGAAGVEALLAVLARLRALQPAGPVLGRLVTRSATVLPGFAPAAVRAALRALARAGVAVHTGSDGTQDPGGGGGGAGDGGHDLLLWATGAQAHAWQRDPDRRGGLAVGDSGFLRIDRQLRSVSHPEVFAAGDCAEWAVPLPKAGVYAVRMGPVLARNLCAALGQRRAADYTPQRRFLALLATADGRAIAARGGIGAEGRWVWRWKDHIDRGFLRRFKVG